MLQSSTPTPPPSQPVHVIELDSIDKSTISSVSLYSNKAEITRAFTLGSIKKGHTQLIISRLPKVIDKNSLRAEGPCGTTIYGPTVSINVPPSKLTTSDALERLVDEKKHIEKALERTKKSLPPIETYLGFLKIEPLDSTKLSEALKSYDRAARELDDSIAKSEKELTETNKKISDEKERLGPAVDANLNLKASIGIVADSDFEDEIKIALIYAVRSATWNAEYEIRARTEDTRVTLTYKGSIAQNTGEDWKDVHLILKTATPTFGSEVPTLTPWNFATYRQPQTVKKSTAGSSASSSLISGQAKPPRIWQWKKPHVPPDVSSNQPTNLDVSSQGGLGADFKVRGSISIPSGGTIIHNETIAELPLDAKISRVCVPKKDIKTYWNARIKNSSSYTLLSGQASVYLDGRFVSKSDVALVCPGESFNCSLGVDPSIRVTYHPRLKTVTKSRLYFRTNTTNYVFSQRITVSNTTQNPIGNLRIIDQIPVADREDPDATIRLRMPKVVTVELINPALKMSGEGLCASRGTSGVKWLVVDEEEVEMEALGKDGKLNCVCVVPKEKIELNLQWKMTVPMNADIVALKL